MMDKTLPWLLAGLALCAQPRAGQVCSLAFDQCPGRFSAGAITVPPEVIWLDAEIPICAENIPVRTASAPAPSIVFVIDNSSSMSKGDVDNSSGGNDPDEARFRVVESMLDTLFKVSPSAEVGLVLFTRRLQFDDRDNPLFRRAFPDSAAGGDGAQHDAYVPLTALNKDFGGGIKGVDTLKALLKYTGNGNLVYATRYPDARPNSRYDAANLRDGTDITLGFEAAKAAMAGAKAGKDERYLIFLSDGEPQNVDSSRAAAIDAFRSGKDMPTTFTVFFKGGSDNPKAPKSIQVMTDSIRANGYSASNPKSAYWAINQPGVQLDTLLKNQVLKPIFTDAPGSPTGATARVGGATYAGAAQGGSIAFAKRIPLAAESTRVDLVYAYDYLDGGAPKTKEVPYTLVIRRAAGAAPDSGTRAVCGEQGDIGLYSGGKPITRIESGQGNLEIRLSLGDGEACEGCRVQVQPDRSGDRESVVLSSAGTEPVGAYRKGNFARETSAIPVPGNGKLEHTAADSIVVTYVNPDNPLDVIRRAFPYSDAAARVALIRQNGYARTAWDGPADASPQFVLMAPPSFAPAAAGPANWGIVPGFGSREDSLRYVGHSVEVSGPFRAEVSVFSNLGQFVNRLAFTVSQDEFAKLETGSRQGMRRLGILWNGRAGDGSPAGTGAYVMRTQVALLPVPGAAGDGAAGADTRIIGVLRARE